MALTHEGLMCIAAGAVSGTHKSYFAAQLRGSGEWLMRVKLLVIRVYIYIYIYAMCPSNMVHTQASG